MNHGKSMENVARITATQKEKSEIHTTVETLCKEKRDLVLKLAIAQDPVVRNVLSQQIAEIEQSVQDKEEKCL